MRWEHLTPPQFTALAREEKLCVLPFGSLERHGDHLPLGTDALLAHHIACNAAEIEPCVVFPPYCFGQVHEACCFPGSFSLSSRLTLELLDAVLNEIARNGFSKILILNVHGGNNALLDYFAMSTVDTPQAYDLYIIKNPCDISPRHAALAKDLITTPAGHACEWETSLMLALMPGAVKMENQKFPEPILPQKRLAHLPGVTSGLWWYADYPEQVTGAPSAAAAEKGAQLLDALIHDLADTLRKIKTDTVMPALKREFLAKRGTGF